MKSIKFSFLDRDLPIGVKHYLLQIENQKVFCDLMTFLFSDFMLGNSTITMYDGIEEIHLDSNLHFIPNSFFLDLNTRKNIQALYKRMKFIYFEKIRNDIEKLNNLAESIVKEIALDFEIELDMASQIKEDDLFKLFNLQFKQDELTHIEQFLKYIEIVNELQKISCFVVYHLRESFSLEDLILLQKELSYKRITLIDIETTNFNSISSEEVKIILDRDLCLIYEDKLIR